MNEQQKSEVKRMFEAGLTDDQIAEKMFYSSSRIKHVRGEMGLHRPRSGPHKWPREKIMQMLQEGIKPSRVAHEIGCSIEVVLYYKQKCKEGKKDIGKK